LLTLAALILIFAIAAASWWVQDRFFTSPAEVLAFEERDWIIIADFENQTGDAVFDKALDTALRVSIEQSSYVNVLPDRRVKDALRRMEMDDIERLDPDTAREIAEREGIKAVLNPSIVGVADTYVLTAVLQDPIRGTSVKSEMVRAEARDGVLPALDELAQMIRKDLGESIAAIARQSKPLAEVTTSSLEALKQYSLGIDHHWQGRFQEAQAFYANALKADPKFTAAMASLGMIQFERFDREAGQDLLSQAIAGVDQLTDKERYGILAFHARAVENDLEKAIRYYQALLALYPDNGAAHNNLGWFYFQMGRYGESVAAYQEAIRVDPAFLLTYDGLNRIYLYHQLDIDAAIDMCNQQLGYDDRHLWAHDNLGWAYFGKGEYEKAQEAFQKALAINPDSTMEMYRLGHAQRMAENYPAALATYQKILTVDPNAYPAHYLIGIMLMDEQKQSTLHLQRYLAEVEEQIHANPENGGYYIQAGLGYGRLGDYAKAEEMALKAIALNPKDRFGYARVLSVMGRKDQALEQLELAIQGGWTNYIWMKVHIDLENLYKEPRFQELLAQGLEISRD
jgi:tetratricopeptide (TPR) repeat protein